MASTALLEVCTPAPDDPKDERGLSSLAFTRLLEWLDDGVDSHGETYLEMRRRLTSYFDRRNRPFADDLADETLGRVGRTLEHDGAIAIRPQARYCYVVAKFVLLEDVRREQRQLRNHELLVTGTGSSTGRAAIPGRDDDSADREARLDFLDRCLQELSADQRTLIVEYYRDRGRDRIARRRGLAEGLGISTNALAIRASRIRTALEAKMRRSCGER
jgi:DNA-directed RNA polymerase specialized sigma24 family protein